jgi:hypothetical protein
MPKFKSVYIAVQPVGSKFAKVLQTALREKVINKIYRVDHQTAARKRAQQKTVFQVTPQTLNKIQQLTRFKEHGVSCPNFCTNPTEVANLGSKTVFARTLVNSTSGRGIIEFNIQETTPTPRAPLYTAYIPKKAEYRVHVFNGEVIDIQQKRKKRGFEEERDTRIRNLHNGYVYTRENIIPPDNLGVLATAAVAACNYQYGAVDVIYNEKQNQCFVLEVNSRPGLMGTTVDKYSEALIKMYNLRRVV